MLGCSVRWRCGLWCMDLQFDEGIYTDDGHVEVDFGLDTPFLFEGLDCRRPMKNMCGSTWRSWWRLRSRCRTIASCQGRVLWSESENNLAQKLIAQLQQVQ